MLFFITLSVLPLLFFRFQYRLCFVFLFFLIVLFAGSGILPKLLLSHLETHPFLMNPTWKNNNVIVVLGSGTALWNDHVHFSSSTFGHSRVREAARLYHHCKDHSKNCKLLLSGGDPLRHGMSESEVMSEELSALRILPADAILENQSQTTLQNALFSAPIIRAKGFDQTVLVTSGFHMRRSLQLFHELKIDADPAPSDHLSAGLSLVPTAQNLWLTDLALHEAFGLFNLRAYE